MSWRVRRAIIVYYQLVLGISNGENLSVLEKRVRSAADCAHLWWWRHPLVLYTKVVGGIKSKAPRGRELCGQMQSEHKYSYSSLLSPAMLLKRNETINCLFVLQSLDRLSLSTRAQTSKILFTPFPSPPCRLKIKRPPKLLASSYIHHIALHYITSTLCLLLLLYTAPLPPLVFLRYLPIHYTIHSVCSTYYIQTNITVDRAACSSSLFAEVIMLLPLFRAARP